jgi:uncharacterized membrane protein
MSSTHWHLLLNHIPVLGVWFALAWMLAALILRNAAMMRSSWVALGVCALMAIPTYLTGEPAEETAERLPGVSKPILEQHEDIGKSAFIGMEVLGALALGSLAVSWRKDKWLPPLAVASLLLTTVCGGVLGYTAYLGGQVRHSEIRANASGVAPPYEQQDDD